MPRTDNGTNVAAASRIQSLRRGETAFSRAVLAAAPSREFAEEAFLKFFFTCSERGGDSEVLFSG
jgi:hypothetical protein